MGSDNKKTAFDKLVAGLSAEDREAMLKNLNRVDTPSVKFVQQEDSEDVHQNLSLKLKDESLFYRFMLWLRAMIQKKTPVNLYNEDIIARLAKKIERQHPSLISHKTKILDSIFYELLKSLKEAADFFKPYFALVNEAQGDFYVFLSSIVAPELAEKINKEADPFTLPFSRTPNPQTRSELLKKLDDILNNMNPQTKNTIYSAVSAASWLEQFSALPFLHFLSQFTNVSGAYFSCPYKNALNDFDRFAAVFANVIPVKNEVTQSLFLFSQKKDFNENMQEKDIENAVKEFMAKANAMFTNIQMFMNGVPVIKLGRVLNDNYDWEPGTIAGAEAWFPLFRAQWRKIIEIRWTDWLREQKKESLISNLHADFGLTTFPVLKYRPWQKLWTRIMFPCELTSGFLSWFCSEKFDGIDTVLSVIMMEGIFLKSDNKAEYSDAVNTFLATNNQMKELLVKLSPAGDYGKLFDDYSDLKMRSFQTQKHIDSMMAAIVTELKEITTNFCASCRKLEFIFGGIFDEKKDGIHDALQNLNQLKGLNNKSFRENLLEVRNILKKCVFYISELEPIDAITDKP